MTWLRSCRLLTLFSLVALAVSCQKQETMSAVNPVAAPNTNATKSSSPSIHLDHAQPKLRTMKLWLGTNAITAELALSPVEISTGMMFRDSMDEDDGMLFVFGQPHRTGFYMKNTRVPLSVAYIDPEGVILEINDLEPFDEEPVVAQTSNVLYVLEMNRGWFDRHKVGVGAAIATERGSLRDVFFPNARATDL